MNPPGRSVTGDPVHHSHHTEGYQKNRRNGVCATISKALSVRSGVGVLWLRHPDLQGFGSVVGRGAV